MTIQRLDINFNGVRYPAIEGDSIVSALLAHDVRILRRSRRTGAPRGVYCGIGHCYECRVTVDGTAGVRACITPVAEGMDVAFVPQSKQESAE